MSVEIKKLIDLTRLSRFKELMDQSVDGKLSRLKLDLVQVVSVLPELDAAEEGVLYLVPAKASGEYDLYAKETVEGVAKFVKNSSLSISGDLDGFLLKTDADAKFISTASVADDSGTAQVDLGKFASLALYKNPGKGQALPGSSVGNVPDLADYGQRDYA